MVQKLDLFAEPYSASGSTAGSGLLNQLGRPSYDVLELLVRESIQNSWDARDRDEIPLYGFNAFTLAENQRSVLKNKIYRELPPHPNFQWRAADFKTALVIYDRGTVGLEGPTRANVVPADNEFPRFADFVFNAGQSGVRIHSAGTYGYGKAAYYLASTPRTICIHTRCRVKKRIQSRFLAIALGTAYRANNTPFTGRWWWGRRASNLFDPLFDEEADEAAEQLGMPIPDKLERGTTILILEPAWGDRTLLQAVNFLVERILYFSWPKMLSTENQIPSMRFEAANEGKVVSIPHPSNFPPLQGFIEAYGTLCRKNEIVSGINALKDVGSLRPKKHLGRLALHKIAAVPHIRLDVGSDQDPVLTDHAHHIALMRQPELIVQYLETAPLANDYFEYCGVFKVDEDVDDIFAQAETPVHDRWEAETLPDRAHKTYVRAVPRNVKKEAEEFVRAGTPVGESENLPLGSFANELGTLLATEQGPSAEILDIEPRRTSGTAKGGGKRTRPSRARILMLEQKLFLFEGERAVEIFFEVQHAASSHASNIQTSIGTLLDGGDMENDPPKRADSPRFLGWKVPNGSLVAEPTLTVPRDSTGTFSLLVTIPSGVAVRTEITAEAVPEQ